MMCLRETILNVTCLLYSEYPRDILYIASRQGISMKEFFLFLRSSINSPDIEPVDLYTCHGVTRNPKALQFLAREFVQLPVLIYFL